MKNTSLKLLNRIDDMQLNLYRFVGEFFEELTFPYLIVGARARDLILEGVHNISCPRATLDTDLAIMLQNWEEYFEVKKKFTKFLNFEDVVGVGHRISSPTYGIVDFIPFGPVSSNDKIIWPPEYLSVMNIMGFDDAYKSSVTIDIDESTNVRCCSLVGLSILKLFALADRNYLTKDADDLAHLMMNYARAGQQERIFQESIITEDFDYDCAGMRLLGSDISEKASFACRKQLAKILDSEINSKKNFTLLTALSKLNLSFEDSFGRAHILLMALRAGLVA